jgi:RNA polymerase sigma-70 factor (sigma-E family)
VRRNDVDQDQEAAYAAYVGGHWRDLVRAAVFLGADLHEAQDLAQTTLVRCYSGWERVSSADNRDAYVYRMLLNTLRDVRRSRWWKGRADVEVDAGAVVSDRTEAVATADAVHRALSALSKVNREVVVLRYFVQLSESQTASALGIPAGTVKSRLSRALAILARDRHLQDVKEQP